MRILTYPKDVKALREVAQPVTQEMIASEEFKTNLAAMKEVAKQDGIGLAATQVGWNVQLFMLLIDRDWTDTLADPAVFVNPKIVSESDNEVAAGEGCLSFPDLQIKVMRPERITWEWETLAGEKVSSSEYFGPFTIDPQLGKVLAGPGAYYIRAIQHEIDHLQATLFIDRISSVERLKFERWLKSRRKSGEEGKA